MQNKLVKRFEEKQQAEIELLALADDMASKASHMNSQNYELLLQTRQQFKEKLHRTLMQDSLDNMPFTY